VYGKQEKRGHEVEFPRWWKAGEKGNNYTALHNILQLKRKKRRKRHELTKMTGHQG